MTFGWKFFKYLKVVVVLSTCCSKIHEGFPTMLGESKGLQLQWAQSEQRWSHQASSSVDLCSVPGVPGVPGVPCSATSNLTPLRWQWGWNSFWASNERRRRFANSSYMKTDIPTWFWEIATSGICFFIMDLYNCFKIFKFPWQKLIYEPNQRGFSQNTSLPCVQALFMLFHDL